MVFLFLIICLFPGKKAKMEMNQAIKREGKWRTFQNLPN
ncbi:hypothetical protein B4135_1306 [Caldibacillus debilis]|nr:hypothetical protein B4135_1306 [Caldibacillus debilis]